MRKGFIVWSVLFLPLLMTAPAWSHCEIPCGIYHDAMRCDMIDEHIATIEKSMKMIVELSEAKDRNYNQLVRWVMNKEHHADYIQDIVQQYFLTQRVKPVGESDPHEREHYMKKLVLLHGMLVEAMKAKQTTDLDHVNKLRTLLEEFKAAYFGPEGEGH